MTDSGRLRPRTGLTARQEEFLKRFDRHDGDDDDGDYSSDDDDDEEDANEEEEETKEEFEEKKRKLRILLDQAQMAKLKITRAFPERLAEFGSDVVCTAVPMHSFAFHTMD